MNIFRQRGVVIAGIIVLIVIGLVVWKFVGTDDSSRVKNQEVSSDKPINMVLDFYDLWLSAKRSTSTNPYQEGLAEDPILSKELRAKLIDSKDQPESGLDPVLCQTTVPEQISTRPISELENKAEILVVSSDKSMTEQAIVTLRHLKGGWYIDDIQCTPGEFAPEREFSFEMDGFLLKSVPAPYATGKWHIVFEQDQEKGHVAPLLFSSESMCEGFDGKISVCDPNKFIEPVVISVQGQMTEAGVEVKNLKMIKESS
jgi:hypothetical protein